MLINSAKPERNRRSQSLCLTSLRVFSIFVRHPDAKQHPGHIRLRASSLSLTELVSILKKQTKLCGIL